MNWYLIKLVFQIVAGGQHAPAQFEEQLRLVAATTGSDALSKAYELGVQGQMHFINQNHMLVQWKFINVTELYLLSDYMDGAELYSSTSEMSCATSYIRLVNDKSALLRHQESRKLLNLV